MIQKFIFFIFITILAVLQFSFFPNIFHKYATPDLILIMIIYWSLSGAFMSIWKKTVLAGFLVDLFYFWPIGVNILTFLIIAFVITSFSRRVFMRRRFLGFGAAMLVVAFSTPVYYLILKGITELLRVSSSLKLDMRVIDIAPIFLAQKISVNVILMLLLYFPLEKTGRFINFYSQKSAYEGRFFKK